ncbi:MAG: IS4 family transposase [Alphaproteobacteria bacterium]
MVARKSVCLRRLAGGRRSEIVRYGRFLANPKVSVAALLDGWGEQTARAASGRHVLAIQDTSEINFRTSAGRQRGLGEIGKGVGRGLLMHAMLALDAERGSYLGLVAGRVWTRQGRVTVGHKERALPDKESERWISTALRAKQVLGAATMVTVVADRESDIYAEWASLPAASFHLVTRAMQDRRLAGGGSLYERGAGFPIAGTADLALRARGAHEPVRRAHLTLRFGSVVLRRPYGSEAGLPESVKLNLVEVAELDPPAGVEPVHWRLLTSHDVATAAAAWQIVEWYKMRWMIEQLFRVLKTQGLKLEDSQIETAERLLKLAAMAAKAAAVTIQLVQARDGRSAEPASLAFTGNEIATLDALNTRVEGKTQLQKNPHAQHSLAWAAWIIAHLGGWDGYPSSRPPGPITFKHGLEHFRAVATGWELRNV